MEAEAQINIFLMALALDMTKIVKELTEGDAVAVYEGEHEIQNDLKLMARYEKAVEACRIWIRAVIGAEVISNRSDDISVEAELIMPDRMIQASMYSTEFHYGEVSNGEVKEKLNTPIGKIDYYTYRAILDTPVNPVKELYKFFKDLIHQIHNILAMPLHLDGMDDLLNKYVVADEGITDVLGVARYDSLWYNIEDFLKDK